MKNIRLSLLAASMAFLSSCGNNTETDAKTDTSKLPAFASTYAPLPSETQMPVSLMGLGKISRTRAC